MRVRKDNEGNILEKGIYYDKKHDSLYYKYTDTAYNKHTIRAKTLPKLYDRIEKLRESGVILNNDIANDNVTLSAYFYEWLRYKRNTTSNYIVKSKNIYERHIKPYIGEMRLRDITHDDVVLLYKSLANKGLAVRTIENIHIILSGVFSRAVRNYIVPKDVTVGAFYSNFKTSNINSVNRRDKYLSFDESDLLFDEIKRRGSLQDLHIATVLFGTGMRLGELVGLNWKSIDFEDRVIYVNHQLAERYVLALGTNNLDSNSIDIIDDIDRVVDYLQSDNKSFEYGDTVYSNKSFRNSTSNKSDLFADERSGILFDDNINKVIQEYMLENTNDCETYWDLLNSVDKRYVLSDPKTYNSKRIIPMIDEVYDALRDEYRIQRRFGIRCLESFGGVDDFIFLDKRGCVRKHHSILRMFDKYVTSYNITQNMLHKIYGFDMKPLKHISSHMARHTFCSRLSGVEKSTKVVQEIMGHQSYKTTADIYNEVTSDVLIKSMTSDDIQVL